MLEIFGYEVPLCGQIALAIIGGIFILAILGWIMYCMWPWRLTSYTDPPHSDEESGY